MKRIGLKTNILIFTSFPFNLVNFLYQKNVFAALFDIKETFLSSILFLESGTQELTPPGVKNEKILNS